MSTDITFKGTVLVDWSNGDRWHCVRDTRQAPVFSLVSFYSVAGLGVVEYGQYNTPETARVVEFGSTGTMRTIIYATSRANLQSAIDTIAALRRAGVEGTLAFAGRTHDNMVFAEFEPGPPYRSNLLGANGMCAELRMTFVGTA